ncbi:nuclear transport factor 2 family protein [soil metagenome]
MSTNVDALRSAYEAFAKGDVPTVLDILDPEIQWTEAAGGPLGGLYQGPQEVVDGVFMRLATEWDGFSVTPHEYIDGGDHVVVLATCGGINRKTGKSLDCQISHVWSFRDGKATRFIGYADTALLQEASTD